MPYTVKEFRRPADERFRPGQKVTINGTGDAYRIGDTGTVQKAAHRARWVEVLFDDGELSLFDVSQLDPQT